MTRSSRPRAGGAPQRPDRRHPRRDGRGRLLGGARARLQPQVPSTVWSVILLAQLGARSAEDERVGRACAYLLDHALAPGGQFTASGAPSGTADCLQGNLCWALLELGCDDPPPRSGASTGWRAASPAKGSRPGGTGRPRALLCRQMRSDLRLRGEQQTAVRLGRGQGDAGAGPVAGRPPDAGHAARHRARRRLPARHRPGHAAYPNG